MLSAAPVRAVLVALVALVASLVSGQPLLAVVAVPFLAAAVPALRRPATGAAPVPVRVRLEPSLVLVGDDVRVDVRADLPAGVRPWLVRVEAQLEGAEPSSVSLLVPYEGHDDGDSGGGAGEGSGERSGAAPRPAGRVTTGALVRASRRGHVSVRRVRVVLVDASGRVSTHGPRSLPAAVPVVPWRRAPDVEVALRSARAAAGVHRSAAAGTGDDFHGVRPARRGDDLRHVDWRASRRTGLLMLDERTAERAGDVVVVLGTGEASREGLDDSAAVAAGLVHHLVHRGDRVRLAEAGGRARVSPPLRGRGGQVVAASWLADVHPTPRAARTALTADHPAFAPGAACVLLGSVLDEAAVALVEEVAHRGHPTVLRDGDVGTAGEVARDDLPAHRLVDVRRAVAADRLRRHGVTVLLTPLLPQRPEAAAAPAGGAPVPAAGTGARAPRRAAR